jgi:DNA-binding IclR family transcriptional regulator
MARASDGESVLHKHLRILDAFDALHPFRTQGDIADLTGLAPSTVHRLLSELEREGLVERLADRSYRLGIRLWEYASRTPGAVGLRELARPWLAAVQNRVRQHAQLGVLSGHDVVFVDRLSTRDAVVNATFIGGRTPLPLSSSGLVLLAHSTTAFVDDVVEAR